MKKSVINPFLAVVAALGVTVARFHFAVALPLLHPVAVVARRALLSPRHHRTAGSFRFTGKTAISGVNRCQQHAGSETARAAATTTQRRTATTWKEFFRRRRAGQGAVPRNFRRQGGGFEFIVSSDGMIVTNSRGRDADEVLVKRLTKA